MYDPNYDNTSNHYITKNVPWEDAHGHKIIIVIRRMDTELLQPALTTTTTAEMDVGINISRSQKVL